MVTTNSTTDAVADAAKAQSNTAAETAKAAARAGEANAKAASDTGKRAVKRAAKTARRTTRKARKPAAAKTARKTTKAARPQAKPVRNERNSQMNFNPTNMFAGFSAFPGTSSFETLFTQAAERGEDSVKRSRRAAEELADLYRANVEAFVEAGRIAANGAQSIGKKFAAKSRDGVEQTANTVRSFAEAKSPTELLQLQADYARTAFDRFVEDSSALTESVVKLAGEAFQPISNRASANVEKLNDIAA